MKKFLSLAMALVMTFSLVTISAGAKDFTDDSAITYQEAVDVVSAVKIVDGYADGSFNPRATLTRGAAAKLICILILGPTTASALSADSAPYVDVPANSTFAGYIAYCQKAGIISGYADGTFKPTAPLTGYAFLKMLLGALGYDAALEGYTGANWSVAVAKQAIAIGLDDGNDEFVGTKAVTREEAALYAFNTLKADIVEYSDKGTNITIGGTTINTGASKPEFVLQAGSGYANNMGEYPLDATKQTVQFAEKYFKKLTHTTPGTSFGDPSNEWKYDGVKIGNYAKTPKLTYNEKVKAKDIYADLGLSATPANATYYVDGVDTAVIPVTKTNDTKYGGQGSLISVYYTSSSDSLIIVQKNIYVGKVTSIDEATKTTERTINLANVGAASAAVVAAGANSFETEDFARKDIVAFTAASTDDGLTYEVESVAAAEKISGELTAYTGATKVTVGGVEYKVGAMAAHSGTTYDSLVGDLKDIVDLYLDANGNVLEIETSEAAEANYAYVLAAGVEGVVTTTNKAKLLFLDGTTKVVETKEDYSSYNSVNLTGDFVTFRVNSDGKYVLTDAQAGDNANTAVTTKTTNGNVSVKAGGTTASANDSTIFVIKTGSSTWTVYNGYKNVPTIGAYGNVAADASLVSDMVKTSAGAAKYVYIDATASCSMVGGTNDVIFVLADGTAGINTNSDSVYYNLKAVVNGEITEIKIDQADTAAVNVLTAGGSAVSAIYSGRTVDKYGVSTMGSSIGIPATGIDEADKGTITLDLSGSPVTKALDKDCAVFFVNKDNKILAWDVDSIAYDLNDLVYYTVDGLSGAVDNIFIVSK